MRRSVGAVLLALCSPVWLVASTPEPPRNSVDTTYIPSSCTTTVASGGNVQTAINSAALGDTICLEAGATFTANFTLPNKGAGTSYITIRTATTDANFPRPGTRVGPSDTALMSKLTAGSGTIVAVQNGAHHYRFVGIEITPSAYLTNVVDLGAPSGLEADLASYIIFDRCYIHGNATNGSRRGVAFNGNYLAVVDSYVSDIKEVGSDTQAIGGWLSPGPFKIVNNYLEASTENVMFGGSDPSIANVVPGDIEVRRNHFKKPLTWYPGDGSYLGTAWTTKNLLELKNARRMVIENNLFENCWAGAQSGVAIVFTPRNQNNTAPWSTVEDILFRSNKIINVGGGVNVLGTDDTFVSQRASRIVVEQNLFEDVDCTGMGGGCSIYVFQFNGGPLDASYEGNTSFNTAGRLVAFTGSPDSEGLIYRYNIQNYDTYGVWGDGTAGRDEALDTFAPDAIFTSNVLPDQPSEASFYSGHPGNEFPANMAAVAFENLGGGDYRLDSASDYFGIGPGGSDFGAFFPAVGQSFLDAELDASGTVALLRFGRPGLSATQSCTIRYGASSTTSTSGGSRRAVALTGLTNGQSYAITVDCGDTDGDIAGTITAVTPSGGNRTVPIGVTPAAILTTAARVTVDYGTTSAVSDGSVQNTSCSSGCTVNLTLPAGIHYWRARWQTSGDAVIATGTPQMMTVH